jgi:hypothetical protein
MVRGLFTPLRFLYTQFPCCKVTGELLFHPFWEAICRLERIGLMVIDIIIYKINIILLMQVLAVTFDGSSINRRLLKITSKEKIPFAVPNVFSQDERQLFFFSDVPHLLKTTRNCWSSPSRSLWVRLFNYVYI